MASQKSPTATCPADEPKSSVFRLIEDHKMQSFRIAIPNSPNVPYLSFRNYSTVVEADAFAMKAKVFADSFAQKAQKDERLAPFVGMNKETISQCWILGNLCESEGFDTTAFLNIAKEVPPLFIHIRYAVDNGCYGNEAVLFKEGIDQAKKD